MEVILLERIAKLGQMGDVVRVKDGFARNFLLPKGKALRASEANRSRFETMKVDLEARNLEQRGEAEKVAERLNGQSFTVLRQAAEGGQLYGSVTPRDLVGLITDKGFTVARSQIVLNVPIKMIGMYKVPVTLHPEVEVTVSLTVARSADEAERLQRGEDITVNREEAEEAAAAATAAAEAFFEPEAIEALRSQEDEPQEPSSEAGPSRPIEAFSRKACPRADEGGTGFRSENATTRGHAGAASAKPPQRRALFLEFLERGPGRRRRSRSQRLGLGGAFCPRRTAFGRSRCRRRLGVRGLLRAPGIARGIGDWGFPAGRGRGGRVGGCGAGDRTAGRAGRALGLRGSRRPLIAAARTTRQVGRHGGGHLGAGGVVLAQEAGGGIALELARAAMAVRADFREYLRGGFAGVEILGAGRSERRSRQRHSRHQRHEPG